MQRAPVSFISYYQLFKIQNKSANFYFRHHPALKLVCNHYGCVNLCRIFRARFFRGEVKYVKTCKHYVYRSCIKLFTLTPRVGLEPTTPRLTAACSTIDTVTYRKISLIECYVQITIESFFFNLSGYHLTGDLTNSILT